MSRIELRPTQATDGGEAVVVSLNKMTIGRGPYLKVQDKRVSRNHATISVEDGNLVLVPIHANPCYLKPVGGEKMKPLPKDKPYICKHGDEIGLMADKHIYKVTYLDQLPKDEGKKEKKADDVSATDEEDDEEEEDMKNHKGDTKNDDDDEGSENKKTPKKSAPKSEISPSSDKKRKLPSWMKGASKRVDTTPRKEESKKPAKPRIATTPKRGAKKKKVPTATLR